MGINTNELTYRGTGELGGDRKEDEDQVNEVTDAPDVISETTPPC